MALNFPSSPTIGQVYSDSISGFSYEWDGTVWRSFSPSSTSQIKVLDNISGSFDGVTVSFPITSSGLAISVVNNASLRINLGGVIQSPGTDYSISGSNLVFTTAPESGLSFSGISLGPAVPVTDNVASVYAKQTYIATAGQTNFNFAAGYTAGFLDVYQNGVKLVAGVDFTALGGTLFVLINPANLNDDIEAIGYKVSTLVSTDGDLTNLNVSGISTLAGQTNASNINASGIVTATAFSGDGSNLSNIISIEQGNTKAEVTDTGSDGRFVVTTEGTERGRIDSSGRLLIGTSTSRASALNAGGNVFQVIGSQTLWRASDDANAQFIEFVKGRAASAVVVDNDILGRILFEGSDGTNPIRAAEIQAVVDGTPGANDMPGRLVFSTTADNASSPTERMRITNTGRLNIARTSDGTSAAYVNIQVSSSFAGICFDADSTSARTHIRFNNGNGNVGFISTDGSATTYSTSSDYRLKENVVLLTGAIDRLQQIPVHRFNFLADPDKTVDGFIAHEAQEIVPECVTGEKDAVDDEGNPIYQGIDQSKLVPLLTAALQEAIGRIETLEAEVAALKGA
jgi:hypothetical protein